MLTRTILILLLALSMATAHDTWIQPNNPIVRTGEVVYLDLMLGNHGNDHRDFRLAGKASLADSTWQIIAPDGVQHDLKPSARDRGLGAKEGYWSAAFTTAQPGLHLAVQTSDQVVHYAPLRSIKSAKAFFIVSQSLDRVPAQRDGFDRVLGHPLELVPLSDPVAGLEPGSSLKVKLLFKGEPLAGARVSCIPRGRVLAEEFDPRHERRTDDGGLAEFALEEANRYLIVAHHHDDDARGEGYDATKYAATLILTVHAAPAGGA